MKTQFDINKIIESGKIQNELDFERALIADRKLKILTKENPELKLVRKNLRDLIEAYESANWTTKKVNEVKVKESDEAELIAEKERLFLQKRKEVIKSKLKELNISQQQLGSLLGHNSKSYMSELMNGVSPFALKDLLIIHHLLKIELSALIPTILPQIDRLKLKSSVEKLNNPKLKLSRENLMFV